MNALETENHDVEPDDALLRSGFTRATIRIDTAQIPPMRRARSPRKRIIALSLVGIAAIGTTGGVQLAKSRKPKDSVLTKVLSEQPLPKLVIDSPEFMVTSFFDQGEASEPTPYEVLHVRDGKGNWFNIRANPVTVDQVSDPSDGTPMKVGAYDAVLHQQPETWSVEWKTKETYIFVFGQGTLSPEVRSALASIEKLPAQPLSIKNPPPSFIAHRIEQDVAKNYGIAYFGLVGRSQGSESVTLTVSSSQPFFEDYGGPFSIVTRNGRTIHVPKTSGNPWGQSVFWIDDSGAVVSMSGSLKAQELLALVDVVRPATDLEWRRVLKKKQLGFGQPWIDVLETGTIGEGDSAAEWQFTAPISKSKTCQSFQFSTNDQEKESCIPIADTDALQMAVATHIGTTPFVYGLTNDKASNDSYVVRITDASGDAYVEDLTTDQASVNKRSFAFQLPDDFGGPLTLELFSFDRQWYVDTFGQHDTDTYLPDDAKSVLTKTLNFE
jgi:hypothetical protein